MVYAGVIPLNFQAKNYNGNAVETTQYDGQILKGIKEIDGTGHCQAARAEEDERGPKTATLKGWFQVSPGGKSGSG